MVDELIVALMAQLRFCVPKQIDHFYYDFSPLVVLAYTDTGLVQVTTFVLFVVFLTVPFGLVLISCAQIAVTVLRVPSRTRRNKAFSTCSSHLAVVSTFYRSLMVLYTVPFAPLQGHCTALQSSHPYLQSCHLYLEEPGGAIGTKKASILQTN